MEENNAYIVVSDLSHATDFSKYPSLTLATRASGQSEFDRPEWRRACKSRGIFERVEVLADESVSNDPRIFS